MKKIDLKKTRKMKKEEGNYLLTITNSNLNNLILKNIFLKLKMNM